MTGRRPDAAELIALARDQVLAGLVPALPEDKRYAARLVAAALAIAGREIAAGEAPAREERARLAALLGGEGDLAELNRRLARAIRAGAFDAPGDAQARLIAHLEASVRARLMIDNPRALEAAGG
ncbi:MAG: hypothetical protein HY521_15160 [Proteobacteria bacterium]|nr:hypothetical protein [Pseudomonadota bacterium]